VDASRLSDRAQRAAKQQYTSLARKLDLKRLERLSPRYFEWYALRTFLGVKLRDIRKREFERATKAVTAARVGDPQDPEDLAAISHGIKKVAQLVGFWRERTKKIQ
jgi:hypothetical protein